MNVIFEVGVSETEVVASKDATNLSIGGDKNEVLKTEVPVVTGKADKTESKEEVLKRLRGILDDAGVAYNSRLGVKKLQVLVDGLPTKPAK